MRTSILPKIHAIALEKDLVLTPDILRSKIAVAMSGGVDSSVTAALLQAAGAKVSGIYMKNWSDPRDCTGPDDRADAVRVCLHLGIPFKVVDLEKEYKEKVIDYFYNEYSQGRTPNPDVMCNKEIKFKVFLQRVQEMGFDYVATGHYGGVRKIVAEGETKYQLLKAKDDTKDQSYFLYTFNQDQLSHVLFPLSNLPKTRVRELAKDYGLPVYNKRDSQGICFVGEVKIKEFLQRRLKKKVGDIVDTSGRVIGKHDGAYFYTLGQREGLDIGGGIPYYVVDKDTKTNLVVVAPLNQEKSLYQKALQIYDMHWIEGRAPALPLKAKARIRHLQALQDVVVNKNNDGYKIDFEQEQRAISPGQSIVIYQGEVVLGGGVIEKAI